MMKKFKPFILWVIVAIFFSLILIFYDYQDSKTSPVNISVRQSNTKTITSQNIPISTEPYHFPYREANPNELIIICSYAEGSYQRYERLQIDAAKALMKMIYSARDDGVWLVPVSGFRTIKKQKLLFDAQVRKKGSILEAKRISSPPGYSEHHTGYTVDLADGNFPKLDLTIEMVKTPAYSWLLSHTQDFGFELSFPENNFQDVSFEPWHWRFIGTKDALETFRDARR